MIARIRALVEKAAPRRDPMAVNEAILDVLGLVQAEIVRHGVTLRTELAEQLPPVRGDKVQLQQVVLNLIVNAIEAMDGAAAGSPRMLLVRSEATASGGVAVAVRDSGPGLGAGDPERLFEAFHSTKPRRPGHGPGDLPLDRRGARGTAVGRSERTARGRHAIHLAARR